MIWGLEDQYLIFTVMIKRFLLMMPVKLLEDGVNGGV